jgi:hypothetical protein
MLIFSLQVLKKYTESTQGWRSCTIRNIWSMSRDGEVGVLEGSSINNAVIDIDTVGNIWSMSRDGEVGVLEEDGVCLFTGLLVPHCDCSVIDTCCRTPCV